MYKAQTTDIYGASSYWWFRFSVYKQTYVDYQEIFQYKKITTGIESDTRVVEGGEISNVQRFVRYRAK